MIISYIQRLVLPCVRYIICRSIEAQVYLFYDHRFAARACVRGKGWAILKDKRHQIYIFTIYEVYTQNIILRIYMPWKNIEPRAFTVLDLDNDASVFFFFVTLVGEATSKHYLFIFSFLHRKAQKIN